MPQLREYIDANGINHFAKWFDALNAQAAVKVRTYLARIENGNYSQVKSVGGGVSECRIDFGPGYRVYFAQEGNRLVILLGGAPRNASKGIFKLPRNYGKNTNDVKRSNNHGFNKGFQRDSAKACLARS